jgi:hypothetical protein
VIGAAGSDEIRAVAVDDAGNVVVAGHTYSRRFPTTKGAFDTTHGGRSDAFVAMFDPTGGEAGRGPGGRPPGRATR